MSLDLRNVGARLTDALRWGYRVHVQPYVMVYRSPFCLLQHWWDNRRALHACNRIAYVCADRSNSGDYGSHLGVKKLVGRPGVELYCAPVAVAVTGRVLSRVACSASPWRAVFVGGGGLLQQCFEPFWERLLESRAQNVVIFGVGAAEQLPHRRLIRSDLLSRIGKQAIAIHVRDRFTRDILAPFTEVPVSIGLCPSAYVVAELGADLPRLDTHLLHVIHEADLAIADVALESLRAHVRCLASDLGLIYDETNHLAGFGKRLLRRYARAAIVVSSRLHGCVFSFAMRKPFVAVACDRKISAFVQSHVPDAPVVEPSQYRELLTSDLLDTTIRAPIGGDVSKSLEVTARRMSEILTLLKLD